MLPVQPTPFPHRPSVLTGIVGVGPAELVLVEDDDMPELVVEEDEVLKLVVGDGVDVGVGTIEEEDDDEMGGAFPHVPKPERHPVPQ